MTAPTPQVDRNKVRAVYERLVDTYGALTLRPGGDPLDELIGAKVSADKAHAQLEAALEPEMVYTFHIDMIRHGRQICHAQRPACHKCPLRDLCDYYAARRDE